MWKCHYSRVIKRELVLGNTWGIVMLQTLPRSYIEFLVELCITPLQNFVLVVILQIQI